MTEKTVNKQTDKQFRIYISRDMPIDRYVNDSLYLPIDRHCRGGPWLSFRSSTAIGWTNFLAETRILHCRQSPKFTPNYVTISLHQVHSISTLFFFYVENILAHLFGTVYLKILCMFGFFSRFQKPNSVFVQFLPYVNNSTIVWQLTSYSFLAYKGGGQYYFHGG